MKVLAEFQRFCNLTSASPSPLTTTLRNIVGKSEDASACKLTYTLFAAWFIFVAKAIWLKIQYACMSFRQTLQVFHPVDIDKLLTVLKTEFGATAHPHEPNAFHIGDPPLPFHKPQIVGDHLSITSFNYLPLSPILLDALASYPELAPPQTRICWLEGTGKQEAASLSTTGVMAEPPN